MSCTAGLSLLAVLLITATNSLPETTYKRKGLHELKVSGDFTPPEWEGLGKGKSVEHVTAVMTTADSPGVF